MTVTTNTGSPSPDTTLAQIVTAAPHTAAVLESFSLDYCCGGHQSLAAACDDAGVDVVEVVLALEQTPATATEEWVTMSPSELVDHLEATHHAYLHAELPRLDALAEKVASVHGGRHPELVEVLADVRELRDDLEPHLMKEERVLFPLIRQLEAAAVNGDDVMSLAAPIRVMRAEHDRAGELLVQLRRDAKDFELPADACGSYRALFEGLERLEADTHLHVHKENNVLFTAVAELGA